MDIVFFSLVFAGEKGHGSISLNSDVTMKSAALLFAVFKEVSPSPVPTLVPNEKTAQGFPNGPLTLRRLLVDQVVTCREAILGHCHIRVKGQGEDPRG